MLTALEGFVFAGMAGVFAYHVWLGCRTGIVRFPVSVLAFQEFERDQSRECFWAIMVVNTLGATIALIAAGSVVWSAVGASWRPINQLQSLNGCYEGEGLPDFMRPPGHWTFRVADGVIFDRAGRAVSNINMLGSTSSMTSLSFSPGILIADDEHKSMMIYPGPTVAGRAYLNGSRANIALADDWADVMHTTSCD